MVFFFWHKTRNHCRIFIKAIMLSKSWGTHWKTHWNVMPYFLRQLTDDKSESWPSISEWKCSLTKLGPDPFLTVQPPGMFLHVYGISELNSTCQSKFGTADGALRLVTVRAMWEYSCNTPTLSHVTGMCVMALCAVELAAVYGKHEIWSTFPPNVTVKKYTRNRARCAVNKQHLLSSCQIISSVEIQLKDHSCLHLIYAGLQGLFKKTVQGLKGMHTSAWTTPDWCKMPPTDTNAAAVTHTCHPQHQICPELDPVALFLRGRICVLECSQSSEEGGLGLGVQSSWKD